MNEPSRSPKLRPWHIDRGAIVYVRQSTPQQVTDHQESTARQYALADRAVELGWTRERVTVIDDDLGKSGQTVEGRLGFQRLLAEVALDRVGLILGLEMSRLARSCKDWHHLLELCARSRTLLADADGVYDPADHNDRLLLGLHGMMSETELHILKERMYQGKLNKARRGELLGAAPIGYVRLSSGEWAFDPDEQVQTTVRRIFDEFDRQGTLQGLLRYLVSHKIRIPVRPNSGANRGNLEWRRPNRMTLQNLLHHPAYAGAYRFGHRATDPRRKHPGRPGTGKRNRRPEECLVLIRDRLPAYITWARFQANQDRLEANRAKHDRPGAPRQGASLLAGLIRCGRCERRMFVRYAGPKDRHFYRCTRGSDDYAGPLCQCLSGPVVDGFVREQILAAVAPAALEASLAAVAEVERERAELSRHWRLRLERARYEAERAARQYQACEPENRLVGRELERRWEESLRLSDRWRTSMSVGNGRPPDGCRPRTSGRSGRWRPIGLHTTRTSPLPRVAHPTGAQPRGAHLHPVGHRRRATGRLEAHGVLRRVRGLACRCRHPHPLLTHQGRSQPTPARLPCLGGRSHQGPPLRRACLGHRHLARIHRRRPRPGRHRPGPRPGRLDSRTSQLPVRPGVAGPEEGSRTECESAVALIREQARRLKGPPLGRFDGGDDPKDVVRPLVVPEDGSARIGSLTRLRHDARRHALPSERRQEGQRGRTPKWGREVSPPRRGGRWPGPWQEGEAFLDGRVREVRSEGVVCLWRVLGHDLTGRAAVAEVQG